MMFPINSILRACGFARAVLSLLVAAVLLLLPGRAAAKPNIVYILADDLGYGDLGCYGQELIRTPRIDRLAADGMRFTDHHAGAPSCAPSRCVLMTGKHTGHARIRANSDVPLRPEDATLAEALSRAGYATGAFGKWGLGREDSTGAPWRKGFDEFFGYLDQTHAHTYYPDHLWRNDRRVEIPENRNGRRQVYSHDLLADEALGFIRRHRARPFFLYVPFTIPHAEVIVPEDSVAEYRVRWPEPKAFPGSRTYSPQDRPRAVRAAMITRMDRDIGRIVDLLDELRISDRTLVIVTSDNGPVTAGGQDPEFFGSAGPLRGLKFTLYEGGIRVPFIARWPGHIEPGSTSHLASDFADMFPTLAGLAGASPPEALDGVSILPTLLGKPGEQQKRADFYWEAAPQQAVRVGNWKACRAAPDRPLELYDLARDLGESRDVAGQHPDMAARMAKLMIDARLDSPEFPLVKEGRKE